MEDDVDPLDSIHLDSDVNMERGGDNEEEEDEVEEDEEEKDETEEYEKEKDEDEEEEDEDDDDSKESWMIGQGAIVNLSAGDVDTMVDILSIMLCEHGPEMGKNTPGAQSPVPAPQPQPQSLTCDHKLRRLIPFMGCSISGL
jgi:hypothetical protein